MTEQNASDKIRIGISSCLLGENVRFDGGHKRDVFITNTLSEYFEWVPVCPEMEIGMGTPRESLRLIGDLDAPRMVTTKTNIDHTEKMVAFSRAKVQALEQAGINGYILKKDSPSCGMERVRVYNDKGIPDKKGTGLFARVLLQRNPYLPVEEEGRLNEPRLRENFITRVFCHYRWQQFCARPYKVGELVTFHARHKYLLMAHSEKHLRALGKLTAMAKSMPANEVLQTYEDGFFQALNYKATKRKHTNVLTHIFGHFKKELGSWEKQELLQVIEDYRNEYVPLIVPLTLIRHYVEKFDIAYIKDQVYLKPHPKELMLLNHV